MTWQYDREELTSAYVRAVIAAFDAPRDLSGNVIFPESVEFLLELVRFWPMAVVSKKEFFLVHVERESPVTFRSVGTDAARLLIESIQERLLKDQRKLGIAETQFLAPAELRGEVNFLTGKRHALVPHGKAQHPRTRGQSELAKKARTRGG